MKVFLEIVEYGLDLRPCAKETILPVGHDLLSLFRMGRRDDDRSVCFPDDLSHDAGSVESIADGDLRVSVEDIRKSLSIMDMGSREIESGQMPLQVDRRVQFEPIVPALVIFAESGMGARRFVRIGP